MKKVRIGVDFHTFDGMFQGSRSHLIGIYGEAVKIAPDIEFFFFLDDVGRLGREHPEFVADNVRLVHMPSRPSVVRLAFQLPWLHLRHKIDLMHMQYRVPLVPVGKYACTIHDVLFESHPQYFTKSFIAHTRFSCRNAAALSDLLFTVSEYSRAGLAKYYGTDPRQILVTYNGVDRNRFRPGRDGAERLAPLGLESGAYLLSVGRLEPRKNHRNLIEAYSLLGPDAPPLVCVGQRDFGYDEALKAVHTFGLEGRVRFIEDISDELLPIVMRHAGVFAYPAFAEGFGMPVVEAMASGVPVLTSNTASLPEVAGDAGVLVDPEKPASIAEGLRRLLNDPSLRAESVQKGLLRAQRFDWAQSASTLVDAFRKFAYSPQIGAAKANELR